MLRESSLGDAATKVASAGTKSRFVMKTLDREEVLIDRTTGLMWQQAVSSQRMAYGMAMDWIQSLNHRSFAGFNDWRLPTLAEGLTLLERIRNNAGLFIDPIFISKQRLWMWTADRKDADSAWYVNFNYGYSQLNRIKSGNNYVRAVR